MSTVYFPRRVYDVIESKFTDEDVFTSADVAKYFSLQKEKTSCSSVLSHFRLTRNALVIVKREGNIYHYRKHRHFRELGLMLRNQDEKEKGFFS